MKLLSSALTICMLMCFGRADILAQDSNKCGCVTPKPKPQTTQVAKPSPQRTADAISTNGTGGGGAPPSEDLQKNCPGKPRA
jgi:hypothetical protein